MAHSLSVNITWVMIWICTLDVCTQWAVDDDGCRTPNGGVGNCVAVRRCNSMIEFLRSTPTPISQTIKDKLNLYVCSYKGGSVKVCCPSTPIVIKTPNTKAPSEYINTYSSPPDVSQHKNLKALPNDCGYLPLDNKIRSGNDALLSEFPWMAILSYRTNAGPQFRCGGSIINEKWILTAAHCVTDLKYPLLGVRTGEHNIQTRIDCEIQNNGQNKCTSAVQDLAVEEVKVYPRFNLTVIDNDVALVKVTRINFNVDNVRPVCLPIDNDTKDGNNNGVVTGWGATEKGHNSNILQKVILPIVSLEKCKSVYKNESRIQINHKHICAGGQGKKDSCSGDSGGPLQVARYLDGEARYVQLGVVSFGPKECGLKGYPGVYISVAYYMDWILDTIGS